MSRRTPDANPSDGIGAPDSYLDPASLPYAFCPGCSHGVVLDRIDEALVSLRLDPRRVVIVTDIGCAGISDRYFATHSFHGLHGRSVTYATGIKLARPELSVIVLIGDGGCGIGGHHLLNAARRNIGVTVVVFNNLNFGMTGGQYSVTTPVDGRTATTPRGQIEKPMDIAGTVAVNGAAFAARTTAYDPDLGGLLARAMRTEGFALVDVWELCVAYYVPWNQMNRASLDTTMTEMGMTAGVVADEPRAEYAAACREAWQGGAAPGLQAHPLPASFAARLHAPLRVLLAGSAGQRIRSAGTLLAAGGVLSGLWATRRDDYPITVRTGHSLAEIVLSPRPIRYNAAPTPDVAVLLASEGAARSRGALAGMGDDGLVLAHEGVDVPPTRARVARLAIPSAARPHARKNLSTLAVAGLLDVLGIYPLEALAEAATRTQRADIAQANRAAVAAMAAEGD